MRRGQRVRIDRGWLSILASDGSTILEPAPDAEQQQQQQHKSKTGAETGAS
jgi:hypothetical protein